MTNAHAPHIQTHLMMRTIDPPCLEDRDDNNDDTTTQSRYEMMLRHGSYVFAVRHAHLDTGAVQETAFRVNGEKSLLAYREIHESREECLAREKAWLEEAHVDVVVSDVVALICRAAYDACIPSICMSNFTWDFIYESFEDGYGSKNACGVGGGVITATTAAACAPITGTTASTFNATSLNTPRDTTEKSTIDALNTVRTAAIATTHGKEQNVDDGKDWCREMIKMLKDDYACASLFCRLPGAAPTSILDDRVIDVTMIVRQIEQGRDVMRREVLGIEDKEMKVVVLTLGGQMLGAVHGSVITHDTIPNGWTCVVGSSMEKHLPHPLPDSVVLLPATVHFPDVIAAADAVIGKIGFGLVSECLAGQTPLIFVSRENFAEETYLKSLLLSYNAGFEMSLEDFASGAWIASLEQAAEMTPSYDLSGFGGASKVAHIVSSVGSWFSRCINCHLAGDMTFSDRSRFSVVEQFPDYKEFMKKLLSMCVEFDSSSEIYGDDIVQNRILNMKDAVYVSRAPGRLDVMGGISDYSGSHALEMPIAEAAYVATQVSFEGEHSNGPHIRIFSPQTGPSDRTDFVEFDWYELLVGTKPNTMSLKDYKDIKGYFDAQQNDAHWAAYIAGSLGVLVKEKGLIMPQSATTINIVVISTVPEGKGVSSSAAVEVASLSSMAAAFGIHLKGEEIAYLSQKSENLIVGAPCGVMDQMTAALGAAYSLLSIKCSNPVQILGHQKVPKGLRIWGIDSGVRHCVGGSDYTSVRVGAFMGLKIIQKQAKAINYPKPIPCLCALSPAEYEADFQDLPEKILGANFITEYGSHGDSVTEIVPSKLYSVRAPTEHPIFENARVLEFTRLLQMASEKGVMESTATSLGSLMYESHASYSRCGLGSDATDLLVNMVMQGRTKYGIPHSPCSGQLFGAKITGGGSGGTICVLGYDDVYSQLLIEEIVRQYSAISGNRVHLFEGSSGSCSEFGVIALKPRDEL